MTNWTEQQTKKYTIVFYTVFTLLNILQASFTQLIDDEAYYWVYSRFLAWGYYDHPPMIAIFIKAGYAIFHNELGVRLLMIIVSTASIYLLEKTIEPANKKLFYAIVLNVAVLHFGGFIAVPDIPLLFFVTLYFYQYKKFLQNSNWVNALFWGISMALMLYSKYHGILIIFFTLLSNWKLFTKWQLYFAGAVGIIIFFPHLYWQYIHGFPSVYYHLWDRNNDPYQIAFTTEYIFGQVALAGPILGWLFLFALFVYRTSNTLEKTLQFSAAGFYLFFLLSSFRGRIEDNWTIPTLGCVVAVSYFYLSEKIKWHKLVYTCAAISFFLIFAIRVIIITGLFNINTSIFAEIKGNKEWADGIKKAAKGKPVLFLNSYQQPSKYWFYSGDTAFVINTPGYHQSNYNIWDISKNYSGRDVAFVTMADPDGSSIHVASSKGNANINIEPNLSLQSNLLFYVERKVIIQSANPFVINGRVAGNGNKSSLNETLFLMIVIPGQEPKEIPCSTISFSEDKVVFNFSGVNLPKGTYRAKLCIKTSIPTISTLNSNTINLIVE